MHINVGSWPHPIKRVPPRVQVIFWRDWKGLKWHRWGTGGIGCILFGSLLLGWVEFRFWRRPTLTTFVDYPEGSIAKDSAGSMRGSQPVARRVETKTPKRLVRPSAGERTE